MNDLPLPSYQNGSVENGEHFIINFGYTIGPKINELKSIVDESIKSHKKENINQLITALFANNIKNMNYFDTNEGTKVEIKLHRAFTKKIISERTVLHVPNEVHFEIQNNGTLVFESAKYAPYEDRTESYIVKSNFIWWQISVIKESFELTCHHNFGLLTTFAGGVPVVKLVDSKAFLSSLS